MFDHSTISSVNKQTIGLPFLVCTACERALGSNRSSVSLRCLLLLPAYHLKMAAPHTPHSMSTSNEPADHNSGHMRSMEAQSEIDDDGKRPGVFRRVRKRYCVVPCCMHATLGLP